MSPKKFLTCGVAKNLSLVMVSAIKILGLLRSLPAGRQGEKWFYYVLSEEFFSFRSQKGLAGFCLKRR